MTTDTNIAHTSPSAVANISPENLEIKRFDVLGRDLSQDEGELTPTLKVKRAVIHTRHADRFKRLYEP